jgi:hypothetical protein
MGEDWAVDPDAPFSLWYFCLSISQSVSLCRNGIFLVTYNVNSVQVFHQVVTMDVCDLKQ